MDTGIKLRLGLALSYLPLFSFCLRICEEGEEVRRISFLGLSINFFFNDDARICRAQSKVWDVYLVKNHLFRRGGGKGSRRCSGSSW